MQDGTFSPSSVVVVVEGGAATLRVVADGRTFVGQLQEIAAPPPVDPSADPEPLG